ncbi:helix-turn-helix transcriptional regulator [Selenomonas ruminantium]|uniref:helix-turn-helix transcriptional regulator n=1 Tax=Selenomonas ruminantium TaxID=971 RepID=UPI00047EAA1F|nr:helix-turn-helix transcriptional regulator [Selenomonas ruminantium]
MLYTLYAGMFFANILFYMHLLQLVDGEAVVMANLGYMLLCSLGMIAYGWLHERWTKGKLALYSALLLNSLGSIFLWQGGDSWWWPLLMFALSYGYLAGHVAYLSAMQVQGCCQGRFIGVSLCLCNLLVYLASHLPAGGQMALVVSTAVLAAWLMDRLADNLPGAVDLPSASPQVLPQQLSLAVMIALVLGLLVGLDDSSFFPRFAAYEETFSTSRIFTAVGYLFAGVIADSWPVYLPVIALAAKSIPIFVRAGSDSFALSLLSYTDAFFTGALIILVIRMFFAVAPLTSRPRLWAGMGRGIEMPASAVAALAGSVYFEQHSLSLTVACRAALLLFGAILFYRAVVIYAERRNEEIFSLPDNISLVVENGGSCALMQEREQEIVQENVQVQDNCPDWQRQYNLTDRETEVLREVMQDKKIADIAAALVVTERTVKFHIGNILKKTDCKNQRELRNKLGKY